MTLGSNVAQAEHSVSTELALEREHVILCIRKAIVVEEPGRTRDGRELAPVDAIVRLRRTYIRGRKLDGKTLAFTVPRRPIDEGGCK